LWLLLPAISSSLRGDYRQQRQVGVALFAV
jgi:hypothetical protein